MGLFTKYVDVKEFEHTLEGSVCHWETQLSPIH